MNNSDFFDNLSDEELFNAYEPSEADIKFRSVKVESHAGEYFSAYHQQANSFSMPTAGQLFKSKITSKSSSASSVNGCPSVPFGIAKTNFIINKSDYNAVVRSIADNISAHENFDFSYIEHEHMVNILKNTFF